VILDNLVYVLDANVFITAHRTYYSFDIAPGFWKALLKYAESGNIISIDKVENELYKGHDPKNSKMPDKLAIWAKEKFKPYFKSTATEDVIKEYKEIVQWVSENNYYSQAVKNEFASSDLSDSWLVAFAKAYDNVLVTQEKPSKTKAKVPIPNLCEQFNVPYVDTFQMLRRLGIILN